MSYQVLARKWRPKSFATLVGQEHVVRALTHALEQGRLHHAYLFTGTRGVGKTTLARIMAKALNCETGVTATPCGVCSSCMEIDSGRFVDYIELDAASNRGVDDMTQLLDRATYAPTRGRFKVYVIDEVHQLSGHAFNAMLKTLEEPPEHVKFILATTDPQKIPVTVLSRCLQFNLKQMPPAQIIEHLSHVLEAEGIAFEPAALRHLAKGAAGSMRDALSLLDQAIAHGAGKIEEADVRAMLGTVGDEHLFALLDALVAADVLAMTEVARQMEASSLSFDGGLLELATLFHRIALAQMVPEALPDAAERTRLQPYAAALDAEFLQLAYQIAVHGRDELALAPDEYSGFVMALLRFCAFRPERAGAASLAATSAKLAVAGRSATPAAAVASPPAPVAAVPPAPTFVPQKAVDGDWHACVEKLPLIGMARPLAQHCELVELGKTAIRLSLAPVHRHLLGKVQEDKLQAALETHFGRPLRLSIEIAEPSAETPAERNKNMQNERQERAIAAVEQDPFVREAVDLFNASIDESTIKPV
ncbi:MAG: DNA polymerase III subunit gamma/tau [Betaproteobacteria bacterium HGW-Betaproteobacteria-11]|nr:MAG: DNA polymerase III subunit gamma/tau [Betaproteobacteria bacterium HGW-Betaproteobacteria-11]